MPPLKPSPKAAATAPAAPAAAASNPAAFSAFLLDRIATNPFLINETPHSLTSGDSAVPSALDPAQRTLLLHPTPSLSQGQHTSTTAASTAAATAGVLQRAIVDGPLLPIGGAHLLHELVWANFLACAEAAKQVGCYRKALQLHESRACASAEVDASTTAAPNRDGHVQGDSGGTASASAQLASNKDGEASLVESAFGASPLALTSTTTTTSAAADSSVSAEELSVTLAPELLRARLAQAQARLAETRAVLDRGLRKLRRITQDLLDYDATTVAELRRQRRATVTELLAPVTVPRAAALAPAVSSAATGEQDRKRQRTAE